MRWPPFQHVIFDCDSTLTKVEGIDVLAESAGKGWRVSVLTKAAMGGDIDLEGIYAKRLSAVRPTRGEVQAIRRVYKQNAVADAAKVIAGLQALGHQIYIVSGGLAEPVIEFGLFLGVPRQNIRAVEVEYDSLSGRWWHNIDNRPNVAERYLTYSEEALTLSDGKARIIRELLGDQRGRSLLVGDGVSDLLASETVDLFVGFGGVTVRSQVRNSAPAFIWSASLAPVLAIAAGPVELGRLRGSRHEPVLDRSIELISSGAITFQSERLKEKFERAFKSTH
jgi:phosphoserine phosphatase